MTSDAILYAGSVVITLWGVAHVVPTAAIVSGFGAISQGNKRLITMEWIAEGLTLCFIGALVFTTTAATDSRAAVWVSAAMLLVMAALTALTGARTSILPVKVYPFVKTGVAVLFILGAAL